MHKTVAKITDTFLGADESSHGIFTAELTVSYGSSGQRIGGYSLSADNGFGGAFIRKILSAAGVSSWEKLQGRTILVLTENEPTFGPNHVLGIAPLPTEPGEAFLFADLAGQYTNRS